MGRLVGLEINNFKSYKGTASVGFGSSNFTSIIGPNGSGKSNMMDAISFVLGVRSSHLRSSQLKDLIYRGRLDETNEDHFQSEDPESAYVMAVYERSDGGVLKLKRTITSQSISEYQINGKVVSAIQYANVLQKENILIKAKNFLVFQGDVARIASQSSETLTNLVELISGSVELRTDYNRLDEERQNAHSDTALCLTKRRSIKDELRGYKRQCRQIDEFDKKTELLTKLNKKRAIAKLFFNDKDRREVLKEIKDENISAQRLKTQLQDKEKELRNFMHSGDHINYRDIDIKVDANKSMISQKRIALIPIDSEVLELEKRLSEYDSRLQTLNVERDGQDLKVKQIKLELSKIKKAYNNFLKQKKEKIEISKNDGLDPQAPLEYEKLREEFLMKGGHTESKLETLMSDKDSLSFKIKDQESRLQAYGSRIQGFETEQAEINGRLRNRKSTVKILTSQIREKRHQLNSIRSSRDTIQHEKFESITKLKSILLKINEMGSLARENTKEKKLRENCAALKRLFPGVHGLFSDICHPKQKKYDLAVSTAAGRNMDALIVSNISVAAQCVNYLKEQRAGFATFIPLDSVTAKFNGPIYRNISKSIIPVVDVVQYDPAFENAIKYAFANTLICDDLATATSLRWDRNLQVKVVTIDGALIQESGVMTSGENSNSSQRWDKAELNSLLTEKAELKSRIEELTRQEPSELLDKNLLSALDKLEREIPDLVDSQETLERSLRDKSAEIKEQKKQASLLRKKIDEAIENTLKPLERSIKETEVELNLIQSTVYSQFCEKYNFGSISEYESKYGLVINHSLKEQVSFKKEVKRLTARFDFETDRLAEYDGRIQKLNSDREKMIADSKRLTKAKDELEEIIDKLESETEVLEEEYIDTRSKIKEITDESGELKSIIHELKLKLTNINKKIQTLQEREEKTQMDEFGILKSCRMENVVIPLKSGSLEDIPLDNNERIEGEDTDATMLQIRSIVDHIKVDYRQLDQKYKRGDQITALKEITDEINLLHDELELINPNMNARDRLEETEDKLKKIESELLSLKDHEKNIASEFEQVKSCRYHKFTEAFKYISERIDSIYKDLTKSDIAPLGGSAYLTLENDEEPYLAGIRYHAMPPMKRFRDMELLSGGEKTVAALALLFAVHSYHPSPFFVLDEIDSALDNANVDRVARYIVEHAGPEFQFIVISLKSQLFQKSDALVGIYKEHELNSSKTMTLDLRKYSDAGVA